MSDELPGSRARMRVHPKSPGDASCCGVNGSKSVLPECYGAAIEIDGLDSVDHLLHPRNASRSASLVVWFADAPNARPVVIPPGHTAAMFVENGKPTAAIWEATENKQRFPIEEN